MGIKAFRRSPSAYYVVEQSLADVNVLLIVLLQIIPSTSVSASSVTCLLTYRNIRLVSHIHQQPNRTHVNELSFVHLQTYLIGLRKYTAKNEKSLFCLFNIAIHESVTQSVIS
ncbi:unnamed protein product [Rotaria sordida]|uniref:Uncharacterized protein n=1 Tax=Rotaria sordida TaxID=392033 RepID=A0A819XJG2_9BILA|nr:unnamed protein product [Rotaria sordida]